MLLNIITLILMFIYCFCILLVSKFVNSQSYQVGLTSFSSTSNYSLATSLYNINFDFTNTSSKSNITVVVTLATLMNVINCTPCQTVNQNVLTFQYNTTINSNYSWYAQNPLYNNTYQILITVVQSGTILSLNVSEIDIYILPEPINMTITSNNNYVGSPSTFTITISPQTMIYAGSQLYFIFPSWIPINELGYYSNYSCLNNMSQINCSFLASTSQKILLINQSVVANLTSNLIIQLQNFKNPSSTYPYFISGTFLLNNTGYAYFSTNLTIRLPSPVTITITNYSNQAGNSSIVQIIFYTQLYFPSNGSLNITFDPTLIINCSTSVNCVYINNTILIYNIFNTNTNSLIILQNFTIINPTISKLITINITSQYNISNTSLYFIEGNTYQQQLIPNKLNSLLVQQTQIYTAAQNNITINFTLSNSIYSSLNQSAYILVNFDPLYSLSSIMCYNNNNLSPIFCNLLNASSLSITIGNHSKNDNFSILMVGITNPRYVATYNLSLSVYSYYNNSFYITQQSTVNLTLNATGINVTSTSTSNIVGANCIYNVTLNTPIFAGQLIRFNISNINAPKQLTNSTLFIWNSSQSCWYYISPFNLSSFTFSYNTFNPIILTNSCLLAPISIYNSKNLLYAVNNSAYCPNVTILSTIQPIVQTFNTSLTGQKVQSLITLTFGVNYYSGDKLWITFPSNYCLSSGVSVNGVVGIAKNINFTIINNTLEIILTFDSFPLDYTISLNITYRNYFISDIFSYIYNTSDSNNNGKQYGIFYQTLTPNTLLISYSKIILFSNQSIIFNVSVPFNVINSNLQVFFYSNIALYNYTNTSCNIISGGSNCTFYPNQTFLITNINSIVLFSLNFTFGYFNYITILFNTYYNTLLLTASIKSNIYSYCGWYCKNCSDSNPNQCLQCYTSNITKYVLYSPSLQQCYSSCPSQTYLNNSQCIDCSIGCQICTNVINCTLCLDGYNLINSSCISICGNFKYFINNSCANCSINCQICNSTSCLNCSFGAILINQTCTYKQCSGNCLTCANSLTNCTSCRIGYLYNFICYDMCPGGMISDVHSNTCILEQPTKQMSFPFLIFTIIMIIIILGSKYLHKKTDVLSNIVGVLGVSEILCMITLIITTNPYYKKSIILGIVAILDYFILNNVFLFYYLYKLSKDEQFNKWKSLNILHKISLIIILALSYITSFKTFKLIYSQLLGLKCFKARFSNNQNLCQFMNYLITIEFLTFTVFCFTSAGLILTDTYVTTLYYYFSIQIIVLCIFSFIFSLINSKKSMRGIQQQKQKIKNTQGIDQRSKTNQYLINHTLQNMEIHLDNEQQIHLENEPNNIDDNLQRSQQNKKQTYNITDKQIDILINPSYQFIQEPKNLTIKNLQQNSQKGNQNQAKVAQSNDESQQNQSVQDCNQAKVQPINQIQNIEDDFSPSQFKQCQKKNEIQGLKQQQNIEKQSKIIPQEIIIKQEFLVKAQKLNTDNLKEQKIDSNIRDIQINLNPTEANLVKFDHTSNYHQQNAEKELQIQSNIKNNEVNLQDINTNMNIGGKQKDLQNLKVQVTVKNEQQKNIEILQKNQSSDNEQFTQGKIKNKLIKLNKRRDYSKSQNRKSSNIDQIFQNYINIQNKKKQQITKRKTPFVPQQIIKKSKTKGDDIFLGFMREESGATNKIVHKSRNLLQILHSGLDSQQNIQEIGRFDPLYNYNEQEINNIQDKSKNITKSEKQEKKEKKLSKNMQQIEAIYLNKSKRGKSFSGKYFKD